VEAAEECIALEEPTEALIMEEHMVEDMVEELVQVQPAVAHQPAVLQPAVETPVVALVSKRMPAYPMLGVDEDPTLHKQNTSM